MTKNHIKNIAYFGIPIVDFLDFYIIKPLESFNYLPNQRLNLTIFGLLPLFILWNRSRALHSETYLLLIIIFLGILISFNPILILTISVHLLFVYIVLKNRNRLNILYYYLLGYTAISVLSFFVRMFIYDTPLFMARGGLNIWGGLTLSTILFLGHLVFKQNKTRSFVLFFLSMFTAVLFISRSAIIVIGVYTLLYKIPRRSLIKGTVFISITILILQKYLIDLEFVKFLLTRFDGIDGSTLESSRIHIWEDSLAIIRSRFGLPVGIGNYMMYSYRSFSNAHDFILTLIIEIGLMAFFVFYYLFRILLFSRRDKTFLGFIFVLILMSLGVPLWQVGGDISFILVLLFAVYFEEQRTPHLSAASS